MKVFFATKVWSYTVGTRALPDIYALALGHCTPLSIVCILYQAKYSCLCYELYISLVASLICAGRYHVVQNSGRENW